MPLSRETLKFPPARVATFMPLPSDSSDDTQARIAHMIRSSLEERVWNDRFLVGLHGPDRNPVRDSVRLLKVTPQRLRKSR